jgi:hypothetical protein
MPIAAGTDGCVSWWRSCASPATAAALPTCRRLHRPTCLSTCGVSPQPRSSRGGGGAPRPQRPRRCRPARPCAAVVVLGLLRLDVVARRALEVARRLRVRRQHVPPAKGNGNWGCGVRVLWVVAALRLELVLVLVGSAPPQLRSRPRPRPCRARRSRGRDSTSRRPLRTRGRSAGVRGAERGLLGQHSNARLVQRARERADGAGRLARADALGLRRRHGHCAVRPAAVVVARGCSHGQHMRTNTDERRSY